MNPLPQQTKPNMPLFKRASLLLFLFLWTIAFKAQSFYFIKGTIITIGETATFFVMDSGTVNQTRLKNFEERISLKNKVSNQTKQRALNPKKFKFSSQKSEKQPVSKSPEKKTEAHQKTKPESIGLRSCSDHFISSTQQGMAISASVPSIKYSPKFLIRHTTLKIAQGYLCPADHQPIGGSRHFLNNYHLLQYIIRPPPARGYLKKTYSNS